MITSMILKIIKNLLQVYMHVGNIPPMSMILAVGFMDIVHGLVCDNGIIHGTLFVHEHYCLFLKIKKFLKVWRNDSMRLKSPLPCFDCRCLPIYHGI